ncbi:inner membrane protein [Lutibacter sp. Hel_I_33_5]|uniref:metal-dependent hydrolase n=1 Tax=Lutibacter sp. Hel_I_33_5 TaxID=1566289 RepID=UPI0011A41C3C|nr:metal-dependent hydrolase [Lutibacter sp. Hel_I_33_5]TVZ56128.1 inner membrane protein [Lutibacter sp. Hel_I_33_5]
MASVFGHAVAAIAIGSSFPKIKQSGKFWLICIICALLPDLDVIGFNFGISYSSFWGHRGFSHSIFFAVFNGLLVATIFYYSLFKSDKKKFLLLSFCFFLCTISHSLLDALTTGGRGVALLSPFDNTRYFFPWKVIKVSPIGISKFFSEWGLKVLISELKWIGVPSLVYILGMKILKK